VETVRTADIVSEAQNARKWLLIGCEIGQRGDLLDITKKMSQFFQGREYVI
jgi:hypothetical protein